MLDLNVRQKMINKLAMDSPGLVRIIMGGHRAGIKIRKDVLELAKIVLDNMSDVNINYDEFLEVLDNLALALGEKRATDIESIIRGIVSIKGDLLSEDTSVLHFTKLIEEYQAKQDALDLELALNYSEILLVEEKDMKVNMLIGSRSCRDAFIDYLYMNMPRSRRTGNKEQDVCKFILSLGLKKIK